MYSAMNFDFYRGFGWTSIRHHNGTPPDYCQLHRWRIAHLRAVGRE